MSDPAAGPLPPGRPLLTVLAPVPGTVVALAEVPDPVFAESMVGPGVALEPDGQDLLTVVAPVTGTVTTLHPHAFVLEVPDGRCVLVHLGIDTVTLKGEGFTLHVAVGQAVRAGDPVVGWSPLDIARRGLATVCPVVALEADAADITAVPALRGAVATGEPLLRWR
ncbi:PTS sugar transporter subunit IIA [Cellulomonas endophytica]|uniref:PTS sugar transporter subunit IIA n=1 Tax=Cellulomonas endophytica TaxID=2494735 RepID=UPI001F0CC4F9|nr:PTS glucose transporter subunit IIA [Cellulomonas endophytica]